MSEKILLGLDIGTQAIKGILVTQDGVLLNSTSLERGPQHPHPGWAEMNAEVDWWESGVAIIRTLLERTGINPGSIVAVGVTALACCLCPVDKSGKTLRPAIIYSDNRAIEELGWVNQTTGLSLSAEAVIPKLIWMKHHEPQLFAKIDKILSANNYFVYRLTNQHTMDFDNASIMGGIFDANKRSWNGEILKDLGIPLSIWPKLLPVTEIAGSVSIKSARETGLIAGTPVIAGTGDTFPTIVGCGAVNPGDAMLSFGTTGLLTLSNRPLVKYAEGPHFSSTSGEAPITWGANVLSAGRLIKWYRDQFAKEECIVAGRAGISEYDLLEREAENIPLGADGLIVLPHFLGRRTPKANPLLRGAILGLSPSHTAVHIYRAMMESFAMNIRQGYDEIRPKVVRLLATAGGARSRLWREIVSNVLGIPLEFHPDGNGALGISFLTAYALGLVKDFDEINTGWLGQPTVTTLNPEHVEAYKKIYPIYCEFDEALEKPFSNLSKIYPIDV